MLRPRASPAMHWPSGRAWGSGRGKRAGGAVAGALPPQPGASFLLPPAAALPGPTQPAPAPGARRHPRPPRQARSLVRETPPRVLGPREPAGRAETSPLGPLWAAEAARLAVPRSQGPPAAAQEMPPPRLSSHSIQTVTAAASPPPGPAAAAPRARRRPPPHLLSLPPPSRLRAFPQPGPVAAEPHRVWNGGASRGGPRLRLTHGAAVDAPLLSSSGSRTDRHPLPLRDQPGISAARRFSKAAYANSAA